MAPPCHVRPARTRCATCWSVPCACCARAPRSGCPSPERTGDGHLIGVSALAAAQVPPQRGRRWWRGSAVVGALGARAWWRGARTWLAAGLGSAGQGVLLASRSCGLERARSPVPANGSRRRWMAAPGGDQRMMVVLLCDGVRTQGHRRRRPRGCVGGPARRTSSEEAHDVPHPTGCRRGEQAPLQWGATAPRRGDLTVEVEVHRVDDRAAVGRRR